MENAVNVISLTRIYMGRLIEELFEMVSMDFGYLWKFTKPNFMFMIIGF